MDETLHMLANPRKARKHKITEELFNNYELHINTTNKETNSSNDCSDEESTDKELENIDILINNLSLIDEYVLNNEYNENMDKINNYLIDLLFLIKSKKNKK